MIEKPKKHKNKKLLRNPWPTIDDICVECGARWAELHEIVFGENDSQLSKKYGFQVRLCHYHHLSNVGPHHNIEFDMRLKRECQEEYEKTHSREEWMKIFGKNYL